jgi:hypothetical protein
VTDRFPGYEVLSKRDSMSWNDPTRQAIDERLAIEDKPAFFSDEDYRTLQALCDRILPQPEAVKVPLAAFIDRGLLEHGDTGTRYEPMPYDGECWKIGLAALNAEAQAIFGMRFCELESGDADALLKRCQAGTLDNAAWGRVPPAMFFHRRILWDIPGAFYAHPSSWNEIGFGGPASPRGYVRMQANRRDPWEAAEAYPGKAEIAARANAKIR